MNSALARTVLPIRQVISWLIAGPIERKSCLMAGTPQLQAAVGTPLQYCTILATPRRQFYADGVAEENLMESLRHLN